MIKKKAAKKRVSLRGAVNNFCRDCIYDKKHEGSWRKQIADCTASHCPLYEVRPRVTTKGVKT